MSIRDCRTWAETVQEIEAEPESRAELSVCADGGDHEEVEMVEGEMVGPYRLRAARAYCLACGAVVA